MANDSNIALHISLIKLLAAMSARIACIVAVEQAGGIGYKNQLPWKLKKEFAYFTKMTKTSKDPDKKNAVIMGRLTWDSIPENFRPLKDRLNVVLTSKPENFKEAERPDIKVCTSLEQAVNEIKDSVSRIWIVGGSSVYKEAMDHPLCDRVYLTEIKKSYTCDIFYPQIPDQFELLIDHGDEKDMVPIEKQVEDDVEYYFRIYQRKK